METIGRKTVREGYAVLLTAQHLRELPEDCPRLCAFTARAGELLFRQALEETGERARADYLVEADHAARARFRVRRLQVSETYRRLDDAHLCVRCAVSLNAEELRATEWIWNIAEETLLPPRQRKKIERKMVDHAGLRQKINNFHRKNRANPLAKAGEV